MRSVLKNQEAIVFLGHFLCNLCKIYKEELVQDFGSMPGIRVIFFYVFYFGNPTVQDSTLLPGTLCAKNSQILYFLHQVSLNRVMKIFLHKIKNIFFISLIYNSWKRLQKR